MQQVVVRKLGRMACELPEVNTYGEIQACSFGALAAALLELLAAAACAGVVRLGLCRLLLRCALDLVRFDE
jgi:hypothetical protein